MNYAQFALFFIYATSLLTAGVGIHAFLQPERSAVLNRYVFVGECLLLGGILLVGEMLILSLVGLYRAPFLWGVVGLHFLFFFYSRAQTYFRNVLLRKPSFNTPFFVFTALVLIWFFRNCYFLFDVDSMACYLFAQRLWLLKGTSVFGSSGDSLLIFAPHFDAVPYALGLSLFGQETLFPELVNWLWRLIALLLVFGYTTYRFNPYYGLAGAMFVLFDEFHFFYSGVNSSVIINGVLIAFVFAAAYNFWEARVQLSPFRLLLAIIFLSQIMANKYHMAYVFLFLLAIGLGVQIKVFDRLKAIGSERRWIGAVSIAAGAMWLWYLKNWLATGVPTFPFLAGQFHALGWTPEMEGAFGALFRGLKPLEFLKYASYLFIWPGIVAAKYLWLTLFSLPLIFVIGAARRDQDKSWFFELSYWLGLSALTLMGVCMATHQDPRYPRFLVGIFSFAAVFAMSTILTKCFLLRKQWVAAALILLLSLPRYNVITLSGGGGRIPGFQDNLNVILNRTHMSDLTREFFFDPSKLFLTMDQNKAKVEKAAWGVGESQKYPAFLLPVRPVVGLWLSSVIRWDSYESEELILRDLKSFGLEWIMVRDRDDIQFLPVEDYAKRAVRFDRYPKIVSAPYDLLPELTRTGL